MLKALRKDQIGIGVMGHDHVLIMLVIIYFQKTFMFVRQHEYEFVILMLIICDQVA